VCRLRSLYSLRRTLSLALDTRIAFLLPAVGCSLLGRFHCAANSLCHDDGAAHRQCRTNYSARYSISPAPELCLSIQLAAHFAMHPISLRPFSSSGCDFSAFWLFFVGVSRYFSVAKIRKYSVMRALGFVSCCNVPKCHHFVDIWPFANIIDNILDHCVVFEQNLNSQSVTKCFTNCTKQLRNFRPHGRSVGL
jgi:hypothetical protein